MKNDIKYYTPDITDLHVGYECEVHVNNGYESFNNGKEIWNPIVIGFKDEQDGCYTDELSNIINMADDGANPIRTKYLTKEQMQEVLGNKFKTFGNVPNLDYSFISLNENETDSSIWLRYFFKESLLLVHNYLPETDNLPREIHTLYQGECKSINEFRKIIKWLGIE